MAINAHGSPCYRITCRECAAVFEANNANSAFCCRDHRNSFGNRRMQRGAVLYDLFMAQRYERNAARAAGIWSVMCRLGEEWREEDRQKRSGRPSWRPFRDLLEKFPYLKARRGRI